MHVNRKIIHNGHIEAKRGKEILAEASVSVGSTLSLLEFEEIFEGNNAESEDLREKFEGRPVYIFCLESFPTPHFTDGDRSVRYFCWLPYAKLWYSTYWRIDDTWDVVVATLVRSE